MAFPGKRPKPEREGSLSQSLRVRHFQKTDPTDLLSRDPRRGPAPGGPVFFGDSWNQGKGRTCLSAFL